MPINSAPLQSVSPSTGAVPMGMSPFNPGVLSSPNVNPANLQQNPTGVIDTLANNAPQSLTSLLMPLYSQLFGTQSGALAQNASLQGQQGMAQAQSSAMQRGLTGSSIESGGMQAALAGAQNSYTQGYASLLGNYVNQYAGAAGQDVSNQQQYYGNIAQALGQAYSDQVQQDQFRTMLQENMAAGARANKAGLEAAGIGAIGNILGGAASGYAGKK